MARSPLLYLLYLVAVFLVVACRPKPDDISAPDTPWEKMSHEDREAYMASTVVPHMKEKFQAHDPDRFADFGCATCHGDRADDGTYEMPNPKLAVLSRKSYREDYQKNHPEMVRFMWLHVETDMAILLGQETGRRKFSCRSCHTHE